MDSSSRRLRQFTHSFECTVQSVNIKLIIKIHRAECGCVDPRAVDDDNAPTGLHEASQV